mgnify:CR=1 FL=1
MVSTQLRELLLQSLVHERGGVLIYKTALECAQNEQLREEWKKYLAQTEKHVQLLVDACTALGLDPGELTPGCQVVQHNGKSLVIAMKMALAANDPLAAERVACECVTLAETKCHADWELIGLCAKAVDGDAGAVLKRAHAEAMEEEAEHLLHTQGWARELWLSALGVKAELPPPEETEDVKTLKQAAAVREQRS